MLMALKFATGSVDVWFAEVRLGFWLGFTSSSGEGAQFMYPELPHTNL